jgi:hypothetical protein
MHGELLRRLDEDRDLVSGAVRGGLTPGAASRAYLNRSREALAGGNRRHSGSGPPGTPLAQVGEGPPRRRLLAFPRAECKLWLT